MSESDSKRVAKNTGYMFIRMILVLVIGLYTSRIVLRVLGFEDFGIYNVVGSVVVFFSFLKMALTNATYRFLAFEIGKGSKETLNEIYSMAINCHIILAVCFFILLETIGIWFVNTYLNISAERISAANWVFQFSVLSFCFSIVQTPFSSNVIAHEKMNFYAIASIIEVILRLVSVFVLLAIPWDKLIFYALFHLLTVLLIFVLFFIYCFQKFTNMSYKVMWKGEIAKEFASYSGWSLTVNIADVTANQSMSIFFNIFLGVVANAALGITQQVTNQLNAFMQNFTQAINPQIIKSYAAKDFDYFMKLVFTSSKLSYFLILFVSLPVVANIDFILDVWLGDYPRETPNYIRVTILYFLIESSQNSFVQSVHATGQIRTHQILMSSIKILSIPAMYIVLQTTHSGVMMLITWIVFTLTWCAVRLLYMRHLIHLPLRTYFKQVLSKIVVVSAVVIPPTLYCVDKLKGGISGFFVSSVLSSLLMCLLIWYYALNEQEKNVLTSFKLVKKVSNFMKRKK